jgi:hypothetical protein
MKSSKNVLLEEKKCAPSKTYTDGSCFSYESLLKIINKYNETNNINKINISNNKEELVNELTEKLSNKCSSQTCWLKLNIIKELEDDELLYNTFRPYGPSNKYDWLSTKHINDVIYQYHMLHNDFLFLGAVPYDFEDLPILEIYNINFKELENDGKHKIGLVINLDEHYKSGSHWVGLYTDLVKNQIYYYDSTGRKPKYRIKKFMNKILQYLYYKKYNINLPILEVLDNIKNKKFNNIHVKNLINTMDIRYNNIQHQYKNTECGVYSIYFIVKLVNNILFDDVINNIVLDDEMQKNRNIFFRNNNF